MPSEKRVRIRRITFTALVLLWLWLTGCGRGFAPEPADPSFCAPLRNDAVLDFFREDGTPITSIKIEMAVTAENIRKGLMWRDSLDDSSGMLFVFREAAPRAFWMRNTPLSLDIIFIGENACIRNIAENTKPLSDETYDSKGSVKYVLEVRAGFCRRYGIREGDCIRWQRHENRYPSGFIPPVLRQPHP